MQLDWLNSNGNNCGVVLVLRDGSRFSQDMEVRGLCNFVGALLTWLLSSVVRR